MLGTLGAKRNLYFLLNDVIKRTSITSQSPANLYRTTKTVLIHTNYDLILSEIQL